MAELTGDGESGTYGSTETELTGGGGGGGARGTAPWPSSLEVRKVAAMGAPRWSSLKKEEAAVAEVLLYGRARQRRGGRHLRGAETELARGGGGNGGGRGAALWLSSLEAGRAASMGHRDGARQRRGRQRWPCAKPEHHLLPSLSVVIAIGFLQTPLPPPGPWWSSSSKREVLIRGMTRRPV
ncbi:hypothetical protein E2562_026954 [Oryza meyeriana var. granulata]|uniref:Uncharacterized protein n=1 Tax=Oryza meyeriana var. granulata TaxID=110450 RepID=A0A6G1BNM1_9ORYZ|nr:hypothetical protein E2562_026954 [Oryza meyeriana var. granulata]